MAVKIKKTNDLHFVIILLSRLLVAVFVKIIFREMLLVLRLSPLVIALKRIKRDEGIHHSSSWSKAFERGSCVSFLNIREIKYLDLALEK